jgi:hypothetical protein
MDAIGIPAKKLVVICYPNDWHWALSLEFLNREADKGLKYDVLDASFVGERGIRSFVKRLIGGSKLQRQSKKYLEEQGFQIIRNKNGRLNNLLAKIYVPREERVLGAESAGPSYNSIVERTGNLRIDILQNLRIIRKEFRSRDLMRRILKGITNESYSKVVTVNGRFTKNATVVDWCKQAEISCSLLEFGSSNEKFEIYEISPHSMEDVEKKIQIFWESSNSHVRNQKAKKYLDQLVNNHEISDINWRVNMIPGHRPPIGEKKVCVFFASTETEYAGVGDLVLDGDFTNQVEAFIGLLEVLNPNEWDVFLRRHPKNPSSSSQDPEAFLWTEFESCSNVQMISPESTIDSIALGEEADLIVNYSSIIAMEFVARGFQNVLTLGPAPWNRLIPSRYLPTKNSIAKFLVEERSKISIEEILPWAYFNSNFGEDFKLLDFDKSKTEWMFRA